ncbi:MAG TPA: hypothetical protein VIK89_14420 [Cytophagaceae bacterium]
MEIRKIVKIIFIFCVLIGISQNRELLAQCSTVPVVEAVFNGDFELGWLRNNGSTYANGEGRGFQSDLNYVGDYNGQPTQCWNNIQDGFAVGRTDILHPNCDNQPNNPYAASSYLGFGTQFKDHTPGLNGEGYALNSRFLYL